MCLFDPVLSIIANCDECGHISSILLDQMCLDINRNTLLLFLPVMLVRWYLCIPITIMATYLQFDHDSMNVRTQTGIDVTSLSSSTFDIFAPLSINSLLNSTESFLIANLSGVVPL
jgi:hypothetical protein